MQRSGIISLNKRPEQYRISAGKSRQSERAGWDGKNLLSKKQLMC